MIGAIVAVAGRELRSARRQPVVWLVAGAYLLLHGVFFAQLMEDYGLVSEQILRSSSAVKDFNLIDRVVRPLFTADTFVLMLLLPAITMRQIAEEWRSGTSDLLLTYPLTEAQIVLGKFFSTALVVLVMLLVGMLYPMWTATLGSLDMGVLFLGAAGLYLYALSVIAIGLLMSAATQNQAVAFAQTFMVLLGMTLAGQWGAGTPEPFRSVFALMSFSGHVGHFGFGELRLSSAVFLLGMTLVALQLATGLLGRRRWQIPQRRGR